MDKEDAFIFFALKHQLYWNEDREFVTFPAYQGLAKIQPRRHNAGRPPPIQVHHRPRLDDGRDTLAGFELEAHIVRLWRAM